LGVPMHVPVQREHAPGSDVVLSDYIFYIFDYIVLSQFINKRLQCRRSANPKLGLQELRRLPSLLPKRCLSISFYTMKYNFSFQGQNGSFCCLFRVHASISANLACERESPPCLPIDRKRRPKKTKRRKSPKNWFHLRPPPMKSPSPPQPPLPMSTMLPPPRSPGMAWTESPPQNMPQFSTVESNSPRKRRSGSSTSGRRSATAAGK
jgi:hypothetical protein